MVSCLYFSVTDYSKNYLFKNDLRILEDKDAFKLFTLYFDTYLITDNIQLAHKKSDKTPKNSFSYYSTNRSDLGASYYSKSVLSVLIRKTARLRYMSIYHQRKSENCEWGGINLFNPLNLHSQAFYVLCTLLQLQAELSAIILNYSKNRRIYFCLSCEIQQF